MQNAYLLLLVICFSGSLVSCSKLVAVDAPDNRITGDNIYNDNSTAAAVMSGLYSELSNTSMAGGTSGISLRAGLLADELILWGSSSDVSLQVYYKNALNSNNSGIHWSELYNDLLTVNKALEGYGRATALAPAVKKQLTGEAHFLRAFFYFYLVNMYGDVPLITSSDYNANKVAGRSPVADVYRQIETDLSDAQDLLSEDFLSGSVTAVVPDRVRPTKWAATALLARVYLYTGQWTKAVESAGILIGNNRFGLSQNLGDVFLANSTDAIWQLQPTNPTMNTLDARAFILQNGPSVVSPVYLTSRLLHSFADNDGRRAQWTGVDSSTRTTYYYAYKYKNLLGIPWTENTMVLRLSEQYLIRAEAKAQTGDLEGAKADLNKVRARAGLPGTGAAAKEAILDAIIAERQHEFFCEWGHRWFDLKRTGKLDAVMMAASVDKQTVWKPDWQLLPIPIGEIIRDPAITQNKGY